MISIKKAGIKDSQLLVDIGSKTFIESHGHSATANDIEAYVTEKYTVEKFKKELKIENNIFYTIYYNDQPAGYSKIILNSPDENIPFPNVTKLEKLYLLKEFYGLKLGLSLFQHNLHISKKNNQLGMWLFVWIKNDRAFNFYTQNGFKIIGNYDFRISENHYNPNYKMLLRY